MKRYDPLKTPENGECRENSDLEGTGDGLNPLSKLSEIKSQRYREYLGGNGKTLISPSPVPSPADELDFEQHIAWLLRGMAEPERSQLELFLQSNPGKTIRDWKGKGPSTPCDAQAWEKSWDRLNADEVRDRAISAFARELPRNVRQAAARHPDLVWNPLARKYRVRQASDLPPSKSSWASTPKTGGGPGEKSKHQFSALTRGRARNARRWT